MSDYQDVTLTKLEKSAIWREVCELAEFIYTKLHELPEEEKWETVRKLRQSANDSMFFAAQALGNASPTGTEYYWGLTRKSLSALKTMYRFAGRQKFIELDPAVMVKIDNLLEKIDHEVKTAYRRTKEFNQRDMAEWRERYELAQKAYKEGKR